MKHCSPHSCFHYLQLTEWNLYLHLTYSDLCFLFWVEVGVLGSSAISPSVFYVSASCIIVIYIIEKHSFTIHLNGNTTSVFELFLASQWLFIVHFWLQGELDGKSIRGRFDPREAAWHTGAHTGEGRALLPGVLPRPKCVYLLHHSVSIVYDSKLDEEEVCHIIYYCLLSCKEFNEKMDKYEAL